MDGTVEDIETRATTIKTYDGKRVVIPNADLFTHSVTLNTAFDSRRWNCEVAVKGTEKDLVGLKSRIVDTVRKAEEVLPDPPPEALVVDLGDPGSDTIKIRVSWWAQPRHHQMMTTHDHVLTGIRKALVENAQHQTADKQARTA